MNRSRSFVWQFAFLLSVLRHSKAVGVGSSCVVASTTSPYFYVNQSPNPYQTLLQLTCDSTCSGQCSSAVLACTIFSYNPGAPAVTAGSLQFNPSSITSNGYSYCALTMVSQLSYTAGWSIEYIVVNVIDYTDSSNIDTYTYTFTVSIFSSTSTSTTTTTTSTSTSTSTTTTRTSTSTTSSTSTRTTTSTSTSTTSTSAASTSIPWVATPAGIGTVVASCVVGAIAIGLIAWLIVKRPCYRPVADRTGPTYRKYNWNSTV